MGRIPLGGICRSQGLRSARNLLCIGVCSGSSKKAKLQERTPFAKLNLVAIPQHDRGRDRMAVHESAVEALQVLENPPLFMGKERRVPTGDSEVVLGIESEVHVLAPPDRESLRRKDNLRTGNIPGSNGQLSVWHGVFRTPFNHLSGRVRPSEPR